MYHQVFRHTGEYSASSNGARVKRFVESHHLAKIVKQHYHLNYQETPIYKFSIPVSHNESKQMKMPTIIMSMSSQQVTKCHLDK